MAEGSPGESPSHNVPNNPPLPPPEGSKPQAKEGGVLTHPENVEKGSILTQTGEQLDDKSKEKNQEKVNEVRGLFSGVQSDLAKEIKATLDNPEFDAIVQAGLPVELRKFSGNIEHVVIEDITQWVMSNSGVSGIARKVTGWITNVTDIAKVFSGSKGTEQAVTQRATGGGLTQQEQSLTPKEMISAARNRMEQSIQKIKTGFEEIKKNNPKNDPTKESSIDFVHMMSNTGAIQKFLSGSTVKEAIRSTPLSIDTLKDRIKKLDDQLVDMNNKQEGLMDVLGVLGDSGVDILKFFLDIPGLGEIIAFLFGKSSKEELFKDMKFELQTRKSFQMLIQHGKHVYGTNKDGMEVEGDGGIELLKNVSLKTLSRQDITPFFKNIKDADITEPGKDQSFWKKVFNEKKIEVGSGDSRKVMEFPNWNEVLTGTDEEKCNKIKEVLNSAKFQAVPTQTLDQKKETEAQKPPEPLDVNAMKSIKLGEGISKEGEPAPSNEKQKRITIDNKEIDVKAVMKIKEGATERVITVIGDKVYELDESGKKWNISTTLEVKNNTIQKIPPAPPPAVTTASVPTQNPPVAEEAPPPKKTPEPPKESTDHTVPQAPSVQEEKSWYTKGMDWFSRMFRTAPATPPEKPKPNPPTPEAPKPNPAPKPPVAPPATPVASSPEASANHPAQPVAPIAQPAPPAIPPAPAPAPVPQSAPAGKPAEKPAEPTNESIRNSFMSAPSLPFQLENKEKVEYSNGVFTIGNRKYTIALRINNGTPQPPTVSMTPDALIINGSNIQKKDFPLNEIFQLANGKTHVIDKTIKVGTMDVPINVTITRNS